MLCILCTLFLTAVGCGEQKSVSQENDAPLEEMNEMDECIEDLNDLADCIDGHGWAVRLFLIPQADETYLATKDPEIKALIEKHNVIFYQTYAGERNFGLELYYSLLRRKCENDNKENAIKDFLATGKFENCIIEYEIAYILN